jgi:hypothetical protein
MPLDKNSLTFRRRLSLRLQIIPHQDSLLNSRFPQIETEKHFCKKLEKSPLFYRFICKNPIQGDFIK